MANHTIEWYSKVQENTFKPGNLETELSQMTEEYDFIYMVVMLSSLFVRLWVYTIALSENAF